MPRIKILQQVSVLQHGGEYTIGYAISNNDFTKLENSLVSAENIINSYPSTVDNLSARAIIKGFLESLDAYKTWKMELLKKNPIFPVPSSIFLMLPGNECTMNIGIETDNDKVSQMLQFTISEMKDIAWALRRSYDLVDNYEIFDSLNNMTGLLAGFEEFISAFEAKKEGVKS